MNIIKKTGSERLLDMINMITKRRFFSNVYGSSYHSFLFLQWRTHSILARQIAVSVHVNVSQNTDNSIVRSAACESKQQRKDQALPYWADSPLKGPVMQNPFQC